ncbi:hypothetical protein GQ600_6921 [Phytophthora cactorum]|nr:hypothetical protein GQ600_6921 [Phytophthora cactorum]
MSPSSTERRTIRRLPTTTLSFSATFLGPRIRDRPPPPPTRNEQHPLALVAVNVLAAPKPSRKTARSSEVQQQRQKVEIEHLKRQVVELQATIEDLQLRKLEQERRALSETKSSSSAKRVGGRPHEPNLRCATTWGAEREAAVPSGNAPRTTQAARARG